jgi:hypothetical protein
MLLRHIVTLKAPVSKSTQIFNLKHGAAGSIERHEIKDHSAEQILALKPQACTRSFRMKLEYFGRKFLRLNSMDIMKSVSKF